MLTIIIPVRNEAENVEKTFNIIKNSKLNFSYEVLFINDFSEDQTYGKIDGRTHLNPRAPHEAKHTYSDFIPIYV